MMGKYILISGILLNCVLIVMERFFCKLPDWASLSLRILAVVLIFAGVLIFKK